MSSKKNYQIDMCNGAILPKLLSFCIPLIGSSLLQLLFNAADVIVVGRFVGDNSLAAVGSTGSLINLLINLFVGLSIGTNVLVAKDFGAKNSNGIFETVHTSVLLSIYSGIFLTIIGVIFAEPILTLMQSPEEVLPLASSYLRIYFLGMTSTMVYDFVSAILRAIGDTKRPLYILTVAGVINVILNLIFVIYFNLGVVGVASATAISQTISAVCVVVCLMKEKSVVHLDLSKLHINKKSLLQILRIGLPAGFQGILFSFSNVIIQSSVNSFGPVVVAGNSVAQNIEGFVYVSMNAYHQGSLSFTSQNYGAHKFNRIKRTLVDSLLCVIVTGLVLGLLAVFFSKSLLSVYTSNPDVIRAGQHRLLYVCGPYFLCGMMDVMVGSLRGIGYSILPMIVSLIGACGLRIVLIATVFQLPAFHFVETVYATYPISWALTFLAHIICFVILFRKTSKTMPATI